MAATKTEQQVILKLIVSKERNKVFFAEAEKDFVDVLFSFLTMPLGIITRLVGMEMESNMQPIEVGSLSSLYTSVENLDKKCLCTDLCKEMLLNPRNSFEAYCKNLKVKIYDTQPREYFVCGNLVNCRHTNPVLLSTSRNERCRCGDKLAKPVSYKSESSLDGFVKSNTTFIITDDLKVVPDSLDTIFHLLKNCGVEDVSLVNEMTMTITKNQVMDLLKSCLVSKTTLTDSFLKKELSIERFNNMKFDSCDSNANGSDIINVKITQRKSNGKILFAQGKEDFVTFLFNFLTLPLGEVVHLMEDRSSVGSVNGLYNSIVDLDEDYWTTKDVKNKLVNPGFPPQFKLSNPEYFCNTMHRCHSTYNNYYARYDFRTELTSCYLTSTFRELDSSLGTCTATEFVNPMSESDKGYVKGPIWYMATDDLVVTPMSSIYVLSLLKNLSIPLSDLEEKVVSIGIKEGISILQASLTSTSALTTGLSHLFSQRNGEHPSDH